MSERERVLVVDAVSDTAEVLRAILEPRGMTVNRVRRLDEREIPAAAEPPAVLVLDADSSGPLAAGWSRLQSVPQVIIGTWRSVEAGESACGAPTRYLHKPFQFAELVQAIEALIAR